MMIRLVGAVIALWLSGPALAQIDIREVESPGGITAWLVEEHAIPFVALELRFGGGANIDEEGQRGAVNLMTALLEEGAGDLDAAGFAVAAEELATNFRFSAGNDAVSVSARFLSDNRDEAVALLRLALTQPRFDAEAIERVRAQVLAGIRQDARSANAIARDRFAALAYEDHPYGRPLEGTEASVAALDRDALLRAHERAITRDRLHVAAVGDISAEELGHLLDALLADLPASAPPAPGPAPQGLSGGVTTVPFNAPQSVIIFGQTGIPFDDPDYFAAFIMTEVLGGGRFSTRLMRELRERRGLTYGVGTSLVSRDHSDMLLGQLSVPNARVAEALDIIRQEWARMAAEGITPEELERAQTFLTGSYPLRFDGNGTIAQILVSMQAQGMPIDYPNTRNDRVLAVTSADIERVAARLLDPEGLHFVVVGQPEGLETDG
ncbi:M16 family metallopeptidase [Plastorhodobacter daqingensis]|uniref:M16 family metallopeptidase n=1 Tax=Plastorhodobacter daqingensis TaxID=1387281 RepID=A0ABW2ULX1_9RHOB